MEEKGSFFSGTLQALLPVKHNSLRLLISQLLPALLAKKERGGGRDEIAKRTFAASCVFLWGGGGCSLGRNKDEPTTANRALKKSG